MNALWTFRMRQTSKKNLDVNCFPSSEIKSVGGLKFSTQWVTNTRATELTDMFFSEKVFTSLVNRSTMTRRYRFPQGVRTNSPSMSMDIVSRGAFAGNSVYFPTFWRNLIRFCAHSGQLHKVA